jgi:hypothetical protein
MGHLCASAIDPGTLMLDYEGAGPPSTGSESAGFSFPENPGSWFAVFLI